MFKLEANPHSSERSVQRIVARKEQFLECLGLLMIHLVYITYLCLHI